MKRKSARMGSYGEALVEAELNLAGIHTVRAKTNNKNFDLIARLRGKEQRIAVKCRRHNGTHMDFRPGGSDWLAFVFIGKRPHRLYIVPEAVAKKHAKPAYSGAFFTINPRNVLRDFKTYEDNVRLKR